jgi:vitamin B12 transporter
MLKSVLFSTVAVAALAAPAMAQVNLADENVVVSATRIATPIAQVASSVTVITAADIEARQDRSLPDVLRDVPGLTVVQTGGAGGQTSLFMRGTNSNHTKILLDGIDVGDNSTPTGATDIGKYLAGDIARVEVLRGPQGALYGSDAIGGVINIITKTGEGPAAFNGSLEGGSFDTFNQMGSVSGSQDGFHYSATLQHVHAGATQVTPDELVPAGGKLNDDYYDNVTASTKLGYDVTDNFDVGLVAHYFNSLGKVTDDGFDPITFASAPSSTRTRVETLNYQTRGTAHLVLWNGRLDQTLGLAYGSNVQSTNDPDNGLSRNTGDRVKLDYQGNIGLMQGQTLVLGAETARDAIHQPISAGITTNAGFAEVQSDFGYGLYNSASVRFDSNSRFGDRTTWRVAPAWVIEETGTKLKGSVGTGFKAPSLEDLFQSFPAFGFTANPNLKPETSFGYDVGVEQSLLDGAVTGGATWFHNDIKNLITEDEFFTTNINIGRARTQGVESFVAWKVMDTLTLRADYTYTDAIDAETHLALVRRPRNKISVNAGWQATDDLLLDATLLYIGPQIDGNRDFSIPRLKLDGYTLVDLAASYKLTDTFSLFGRIENAFDTRYQSPDGFLRPGIGATGGIKVNL